VDLATALPYPSYPTGATPTYANLKLNIHSLASNIAWMQKMRANSIRWTERGALFSEGTSFLVFFSFHFFSFFSFFSLPPRSDRYATNAEREKGSRDTCVFRLFYFFFLLSFSFKERNSSRRADFLRNDTIAASELLRLLMTRSHWYFDPAFSRRARKNLLIDE